MGINPNLKPYMEDIIPLEELTMENTDRSGEGEVEFKSHQELVNNAIENLDELSLAQDRLEEIKQVQTQNLQSLDNTTGEFAPVEGGFQAPLTENEDEVVAVVSDQMYKEQLVVENIAGMLGCVGNKHLTGTDKLYKTLGVRISPYSPKDVKTESFGERNRKIKALGVYKSHCEGIGDAIKKMGSAVLVGVKKLIQAIIDFIKNIFNRKNDFIKKLDINIAKLDEIKKHKSEYNVKPEYYSREVGSNAATTGPFNAGTIALTCRNLFVLENNMVSAITYASTLMEEIELVLSSNEEDKEQSISKIKDLDKNIQFQDLQFDEGMTFVGKNFNGIISDIGILFINSDYNVEGNPVKYMLYRFDTVDDVVTRGEMISSIGRNTIKGMLSDSQSYRDKLNRVLKLINSKSEGFDGDIRPRVILGLKLIHTVFISAIGLINGLEYLNNMVERKS